MIISSLFFTNAIGQHTINPLVGREPDDIKYNEQIQKIIGYKLDSSAWGVLGETSVALATPILPDS